MDLTNRSIAQVIKMRKLRWFSALAALALAACGGGSSCGTSFANTCGSGGGPPPVTIGSLKLLTSLPQIKSDSSNSATISALVKDASNNVMPNVAVDFQADSGSLAKTQGTTDANGLALATLNAGSDPTNRTIAVTATVGTTVATVTVDVMGTTLALSGATSLVLNASGSYSVVLTNSAGQGISGAMVTLTSSSGNVITPGNANSTTDASGRLNFTMAATVGGPDTVTATALGLQRQVAVAISTESFKFSAPADGTQVTIGNSQSVTVTWLSNNVPVVGMPVTFSATRGILSQTTPINTDVNGQATVSVSSTGAGPSVVNANAAGVTAQLNLNFVANNPSQISVQAGPASVGIQALSTITAVVRDAANNLVQGATVTFQLTTDPTNGGLSAASAVTNSQGSAQVIYTAGNSSSGANGVTITASVQNLAATATYSSNTKLTVGGQTVFLSLGTGNTIDISQGPAVYQVIYTVFAVDSGGAALPNVPVTMAILPVAYGKGTLKCLAGATNWTPSYTTLVGDPKAYKGQTLCTNEDTDYTGNINSLGQCPDPNNPAPATVPCKDYNLNAKLDPGNVAVVAPASGITDINGRLDVKITYPRDHSYWTVVSLVASTTVQGTQSSTSATFVLVGADVDYKCSIGPPGPVSPYGVAASCATAQ
jgi:hypothetical protein